MKSFNVFFLLLSLISTPHVFATHPIWFFDDIKNSGGFKSAILQDVVALHPSVNVTLEKEEVEDLANSPHPVNLKTLGLANQPHVTDDVIQKICQNPAFSRIISFNLSNTSITSQALTYLLDSDSLGSIRDLPQISGKFGGYSSVVYVRVDNVPTITDKILNPFNTGNKNHKNFQIHYRHPQSGETTSPSRIGIKTLEVKDY